MFSEYFVNKYKAAALRFINELIEILTFSLNPCQIPAKK